MRIGTLGLIIVLFSGCSSLPTLSDTTQRRVHFSERVLPEASGIVSSRIAKGIFWLINDSGNPADLIALDSTGHVASHLSLPNIINYDWESITLGPDHSLIIGDLGNNRRQRQDQTLIRLQEPNPINPIIQGLLITPVYFSDLKPFGNSTPDIEALFTVGETLWIFTKQTNDQTLLCRLNWDSVENRWTVIPVQTLFLPGQVTGADYNPQRELLAVLTYSSVTLYPWNGNVPHIPDRPIKTRPLFFQQAEGICWDGNSVRVVNEQGGMLRIRLF